MRVIDFGSGRAVSIAEFGSRRASAQPLGHGAGETHVYAVHIDAGGEIGPHPAGYGQLFLVIAGAGWVAGGDGVRVPVGTNQGAVIGRGELHAKGSESGLTAIMIQVAELAAAES